MEIILSQSHRISWKDCNGILIAGQSGSGKSQTASLIIGQLAYQGVQLIPCDFESPYGEPDALAERISFCSGAFLYPVATDAQDILHRIDMLKAEYQKRRKDPDRRDPWLLIIDEFSAFLSYLRDIDFDGETDPIAAFARLLMQMRKLNMRALVIGQEWSSGFATTSMRHIRSAFPIKLIHKLDGPNTKMLLDGADINAIRTVGALKTGHVFFRENTIPVPYVDNSFKYLVTQKIARLPHSNAEERDILPEIEENVFDQDFLDELFLRYGQVAGYNLDYTDRQVIVKFWIAKGYSDYAIAQYLVKGKAQDILKICKDMRERSKQMCDF